MQVKHVPEVTRTVVEQEEQYVLTLTKQQAQAIRALLRHVISGELNDLGIDLWDLPPGMDAWDSNQGREAGFSKQYLPAMSFKPQSGTQGAPDAS